MDDVKAGCVRVTIVAAAKDGSTVDIMVNYDFLLEYLDRVKGAQVVVVPTRFLNPKFTDTLRHENTMDDPDFHAADIGKEDVVTADGKTYVQADHIQLTEIAQPPRLTRVLEVWDGKKTQGERLSVSAFVNSDLPVFGAASVDIQTTIGSTDIFVGGDFAP